MNFRRQKYRFFFLMLLWAGVRVAAWAQDTLPRPQLALDTVAPTAASPTVRGRIPLQATRPANDSSVVDLSNIKTASGGLTEVVEYEARDSMWFDVTNKQVHLYGLAKVKYTSLEITAGYILLDYDKNEVTATTLPDSTGRPVGEPEFKEKDQNFTANKLRYNFKTKKGIIYEARTKQEDLYVLGQRAKIISPPEGDTTARPVIYNQDAILTTCNAPHPHFGIRTQKLKVIPDKVVVTGVSNLELAGIPTPFVLPFGFYPITKTRKAGLIIPQDFNFAETEGLGVQGIGWYQPINDHLDAKVLFNAFVNGTWGVSGNVNYNHRYKHNGSLLLSFNNRVRENERAQKVSNKSFRIELSHNQASKAHPTRQFGGRINIETNRDQNRNRNDFQSVSQNTLSSNLRYSRSFPGRPYQFNASFAHSQNVQNRKMQITLPEATFTVQRIFPFKRKVRVGSERWYEKISLQYNSQLRNQLQDVPDTLLFTRQALKNYNSGIQHKANTDFNFKILKYINVSPNIRYEENWYPFTIRREFDPTPTFRYDTVRQDGEVIAIKVDSARTIWGRDTILRDWGFKTFRTFNAGVSVGTVLFATKQFKRGWLRGVRHKLTPSASMSYAPDFSRNEEFFRDVETTSQPGRSRKQNYSIFDQSLYGRPSNSPQSYLLSYSLSNMLELKHASKRDTTGKGRKVVIFNNLAFSGNYNFSADSLRWSTVGTSGNIPLWKGISTLTWRVVFDPYQRNTQGIRIDEYFYKQTGRLLRTDQLGFQVNTQFTINQLRALVENRNKNEEEQQKKSSFNTTAPDDLLGWFDRFSIDHRIGLERQYVRGTNRDTLVVPYNTLSLRGDIPLTPKWTLNISNVGYDFQSRQLVYPDLGISRDLHCWTMSLSWQPTRGTYSFFIAAKPGTFAFLKVPYRKNNFDGTGGF
jgi:LptD protein